jgi:excisionase family DNA binding protein
MITAATLRKYPDLMDVRDIQAILHIGRSKAYALLKSGKVHALRIGAVYRIPKQYLLDFLNGSS